jgi:hypothetical protein
MSELVHAHTDDAVVIHQMEDIMADVLGWLCVEEIMGKRRVCKKWKEAAKKTIVPLCEFVVNNVESYNAMRVMTTEMPNLRQIMIGALGGGHKYNEGEDPDEGLAYIFSNLTSHDIEIISNFTKLRTLSIGKYTGLNGRCPVFFNFPLLQKLSIQNCYHLKWDLGMLAGLPVLKELDCFNNQRCVHNNCVTGNISSLRVLKGTLEMVIIRGCQNVEGNFMDLADFPHLKELDLYKTTVTGDIRDIGENDFSSLECLKFPKVVYGGEGYELERISDGTDLVRAVYLLKKQRPALIDIVCWYGKLSWHSPDWYDSADELNTDDTPPFYIHFVVAGPRIGYRWQTDAYYDPNPCEVNWLDPEPDRESSDYGQYIEELQKIENEVWFYKGFHQPPTEEEYIRLVEEYADESEEESEESDS